MFNKRIHFALILGVCVSNSTFATDQTLVVHRWINSRLDSSITEVLIKGPQTNATSFELTGYHVTWKCEAWPWDKKREILLTCHSPDSSRRWKLQAAIACDSEAGFFIDAITIKCKGDVPVRF